MPATYLLLRNNKQSGPHNLEELLQCNLDPHDLIWEEGRSAGWHYPFEVQALKPFISQPETETPAARNTEDLLPTKKPEGRSVAGNQASHIYVALPAGMTPPPAEEQITAPSLEEKAEALYQRVQAFSEGHAEDIPDTGYSRSLEEMKDSYGDWLLKQQQKKKRAHVKKRLLIAASFLIVTMTGFSVSKWIKGSKSPEKAPVESMDLQSAAAAKDVQTTTASFALVTDSFAVPAKTPTLEADTFSINTNKTIPVQKESKSGVGIKKKPVKQKQALTLADTLQTNQSAPQLPVLELMPIVTPTVKKSVRLSQQVTVRGTLATGKKEATIVLNNNSNETLRSVAVIITYYKKDGRPAGKETVHFQQVPPSGAPVIIAEGNRRAATARFEIGTIVRADGSLYLIH